MLTISTDASLVDVALVHRWLSTDAYWALNRPREVVEQSVASSLNVGAYDDGVQVGYARIVTDRTTFAWICDVYVDPARRGSGIGKSLVSAVVAELEPLGLSRVMLATADAHALYAAHGFVPLPDASMIMVLERPSGPVR
jgi:GNAT superfamily N-acetyltransferase